jgi:hypothetical protein
LIYNKLYYMPEGTEALQPQQQELGNSPVERPKQEASSPADRVVEIIKASIPNNPDKTLGEIVHTPPDYVVEDALIHRKPPEVRIWTLRNQSRVGTCPPSTSTPHCPAC